MANPIWKGTGSTSVPTSGNWSDATNWSTGAVPVAGDAVTLGGGTTTYTVTLDVTAPATGGLANLSIAGTNATLAVGAETLNVNATVISKLTTAGNITIAGGTITTGSIGTSYQSGAPLAGFLSLSGTITSTGTGSPASTISGGLFDCLGTLNVTSGTLSFECDWTNDFEATATISSGAAVTVSGAFGNNWTIHLSGTLTITGNATANAGSIQLAGGVLNNTGTGGFSDLGGAIVCNSGTNTIDGGVGGINLSAGGVLAVESGATLAVNNAVTAPAGDGGILIIGVMTMTGALTIGPGCYANIQGSLTVTSTIPVVNEGSGMTIYGTLSIPGTGGLSNTGATASILFNGGTLNSSAGIDNTSTSTVASNGSDAISGFGTIIGPLSGAGVVSANGGMLDIQSDITATDVTGLQIDAGATLQIDGTVAAGNVVTFVSNTAGTTLVITSSSIADGELGGFAAAIVGLLSGSYIDLTAVPFANVTTVDLTSGDLIAVTTTGGDFNLQLGGPPQGEILNSTDGVAGTFIYLSVSGMWSSTAGTDTFTMVGYVPGRRNSLIVT